MTIANDFTTMLVLGWVAMHNDTAWRLTAIRGGAGIAVSDVRLRRHADQTPIWCVSVLCDDMVVRQVGYFGEDRAEAERIAQLIRDAKSAVTARP